MTAADAAFLGLELGTHGAPSILPVTPQLCTPFGFLYGGSGLAACAVAGPVAAA